MRRIIRKLKILEVSGCDRPAQEPAKVVIMKRDDPSATPMTDRLADLVDDYRRMFPDGRDEDYCSRAWDGLSSAIAPKCGTRRWGLPGAAEPRCAVPRIIDARRGAAKGNRQ